MARGWRTRSASGVQSASGGGGWQLAMLLWRPVHPHPDFNPNPSPCRAFVSEPKPKSKLKPESESAVRLVWTLIWHC
eukprot:2771443-Pyramimonas_sp.AAC.1